MIDTKEIKMREYNANKWGYISNIEKLFTTEKNKNEISKSRNKLVGSSGHYFNK